MTRSLRCWGGTRLARRFQRRRIASSRLSRSSCRVLHLQKTQVFINCRLIRIEKVPQHASHRDSTCGSINNPDSRTAFSILLRSLLQQIQEYSCQLLGIWFPGHARDRDHSRRLGGGLCSPGSGSFLRCQARALFDCRLGNGLANQAVVETRLAREGTKASSMRRKRLPAWWTSRRVVLSN